MIEMEVCANSVASAIAAAQGGARRVELCDNLGDGGTTPSYGQIKLTRKKVDLDLYVIIRPRGGDFMYDELEFEIMKHDILICKSLGCDGVVFGILKSDGTVDQSRCADLVSLARPMKVTFHRAFDMTKNLYQALEDIIELDFDRILTSGGAEDALLGAQTIKALITQAADRIEMMPGAGVRTTNVAELIKITHASTFHSTAKKVVESNMRFKLPQLSLGKTGNEFAIELTDADTVREMIKLANENVL